MNDTQYKSLMIKYMKRKTIIQISEDNIIIPTTTKELKGINSIIKHPSNQTKLDDDKIKEMCKIYNEDSPYKKFFLSCALITIAKLVVGDNEDYYLVDGQHRLNMAFDLLEQNEDNNMSFLLCIITIKQKKEMIDLMNYINKDSSKYIYHDYPIFDQILFEQLKELYIYFLIYLLILILFLNDEKKHYQI